MKKRYSIQVRNAAGAVLGSIQRKPWLEAIGNFNPMFVRYKGKRTLVQSDEGDVSDPFRRKESYADSFFIVSEIAPPQRKAFPKFKLAWKLKLGATAKRFVEQFGTLRGRRLARQLGFQGERWRVIHGTLST